MLAGDLASTETWTLQIRHLITIYSHTIIKFRSTTFYKNERKITVCKAHDRTLVVSLKKHQREISVPNENSSLKYESDDCTN